MNKLIIGFFLALTFNFAMAEEYSTEYSVLNGNEFDFTVYNKDPDAEAVVMFDKGESRFIRDHDELLLIFERSTRIKVLTEGGKQWANVSIPFYREGNIFEKVYDISAIAYNKDGDLLYKTSLDENDIYEETINDRWGVKKFVVPNVQPGTVIEYTYKIESNYIFNLHDWDFQWEIPVMYSEYVTKMVPFYEYTSLILNTTQHVEKHSFRDESSDKTFANVNYKDMVYTNVMRDVPAFHNEEFITSMDDYLMKIDFQLSMIHYPDGRNEAIVTTWDKMEEDLLKSDSFGRYIKKSAKSADKCLDVEKLSLLSEQERFDAVVDYVKLNYKWNGRNSKYSSCTVSELLKKQIGFSADLNLFAIGLLKSVGLEAYPLIISTRDHGRIRSDYPFAHYFNYSLVSVKIDGAYVLSDMTSVNTLNRRVPTRCINGSGLLIDGQEGTLWLNLSNTITSTEGTSFTVKIDENLDMDVKVSKKANEYNALYYRNKYADDSDMLIEYIESKGRDYVDSSLVIKNAMDKNKPYSYRYHFASACEGFANKIYLSPFFDEVIDEVPFKQKERSYPIDMINAKKKIFSTAVSIPTGYKVEVLPANRTINTSLFNLSYTAKEFNGFIKIDFSYHFKNAVYAAYDYSKLKFYYQEIAKKGAEKVVFSKIE